MSNRELLELIKESGDRIFYHITDRSNYESIMKSGLLPKVGPRRSKKLDKEDLIFMTVLENVNSWRSTFLSIEKNPIKDPIVLRVDCHGVKLKVRACYRDGVEIASSEIIPPNRIELTEL